MECTYCHAPTAVANSRPQLKTSSIWRRRKCSGCGAVFTTREMPDYDKSLLIDNRGTYQAFERDRLFSSVLAVCGHRSDAVSASTALTATIVQKLLPLAQDGLLTRRQIVHTTETTLKRFDTAAAVQYAAYHPL